MKTADLQAMRDWAHDKASTGYEPPWAWYQYMKLVETLDAILAGMASTKVVREVGSLRLVAADGMQDDSGFHPPQPPFGAMPI